MALSSNLRPFDTLWLGVHKTGTTFLQKSLDLSQAALQDHAIKYVELAEFRRLYTRPLLHANHTEPPAPAWQVTGADRQRLVFDENIMALVQNTLGGEGLYPYGSGRARVMADYLGLLQPRIVLGLRSFRSFLPSLYCEALKSTAFRPFDKFSVTPWEYLSWDDLVGRLIAAFPGSEVVCYAAEGLRGRERDLLAKVTGLPPEELTLLDGQERPGFSDAAVRALEDLAKTGSGDPGRRISPEQAASASAGRCRFQPLDPR